MPGVRLGRMPAVGLAVVAGQRSGESDRKCSELACNVRSHRADVGSQSVG
jgi:hypothetical protein